MGSRIVIDDGVKTYDICNRNGDILGSFSINPTDSNMVKRYEEVVEHLNNLEIPEEESAVKMVEEKIAEEFNYLFNADVSENFFSIAGALTPLQSGELYVENVLNAIVTVIQKEFGTRGKKMQEHITKYTAKYNSK